MILVKLDDVLWRRYFLFFPLMSSGCSALTLRDVRCLQKLSAKVQGERDYVDSDQSEEVPVLSVVCFFPQIVKSG